MRRAVRGCRGVLRKCAPRIVVCAAVAFSATSTVATGEPPSVPEGPYQGQPDGGCTISVVGLEFGDYDGHNPQPLDGIAYTTINCSAIPGEGGVREARVQISRGSSPTYFPRTMVGPGGNLNYNLFLDPTRQTVWGDDSGGTDDYFIDRPQPNRDITIPIYGRVEPLQPVSAGRYMDILTVTVLF